MPEKRPVHEYRLISRTTGNSLGGFETLASARQYAREESLEAWDTLSALGVYEWGYSGGVIHMHRQGRRAPHFEPMRCDYCRKSFGLILHRYYRMRFCSADCLQAYQHRLDDRTIIQISDTSNSASQRY